MITRTIPLDPAQYVRANITGGAFVVEARGGFLLKIADGQPQPDDSGSHVIKTGKIYPFPSHGSNVWLRAKNAGVTALISEETPNADIADPLRLTSRESLFHAKPVFDLLQSIWFIFHGPQPVPASPYAVVIEGVANVSSNVAVPTVRIESRLCVRYQPGRPHIYFSEVTLPNPTADGNRDFGLSTAQNGIYFRRTSTGLRAIVKRLGVEIVNEPINTSEVVNYLPESINGYIISFTYIGRITFSIISPYTGEAKKVHVVNLTTQYPTDTSFPVSYQSTRLTEDVTLGLTSVDVSTDGGLERDVDQYSSVYAEDVDVNGTDQPIAIINFPALIGSGINTFSASIVRITVNVSKKSLIKFYLARNPAAITGATFQSVTGPSYMLSDSTDNDPTAVRATAINPAMMRSIRAFKVEANVSFVVVNPFRESGIESKLVRGDYFVVACDSSTAVATVNVEWSEGV